MKLIVRSLLLILASAWAGSSLAQGHIVLKPNASLNIGILTQPSVQKELKFDEAKAKAITSLVAGLQEKMRFQVSGGDMEEMKQQLQDQNEEFEANALKVLKSALSAEEFKRFSQLNLQSLGLGAMSTKSVTKVITLTSEQRKIVEAESAKIDELSQSLFSSSASVEGGQVTLKLTKEQEKQLSQAKKSAFMKLAETFSAEQKSAWETLVGGAFDFSQKV